MSPTLTIGNRFVFVAPMYNASTYVGQMLASIVGQSYTNWKVILIDDVSDPHEVMKEKEIIERWQRLVDPGQPESRIQVIWNDEKKWEVANVLHGIGMCEDDDIVCRIDADDWLTELDALAIISAAYTQLGVDCLWTAHRWGFSDKNISGPMPPDADPYKHQWVTSHLKTFRKHLINGVPYKNFTNMNDDLVRRAGDQSLYLPILHNARRRAFLPRVMYHYTIDEQGGAVYQTDDAKFQKAEADFLRARGYIAQGKAWEEVVQTS
jgi:glycosyltransferase involved in cell wall biosynthesis